MHGFAAEQDFVVANTWMDGATDEQLHTRTNWDGTGAAQMVTNI